MEQQLGHKLDKIEERLLAIDKTLAINTESLKEHMRRTELNERSIDKLVVALAPVQLHVTRVDTVLKVFGAIGILIGVAAGAIKIVEFFIS